MSSLHIHEKTKDLYTPQKRKHVEKKDNVLTPVHKNIKISDPELTDVLSVFTEKGGVGKTTICDEMARGYHRRGLKVLIIDCDPQNNVGHLTYSPQLLKKLKEKYNLMDIVDFVSTDITRDDPKVFKGDCYDLILGNDVPPTENSKFDQVMNNIYNSNNEPKSIIRDLNLTNLINNFNFLKSMYNVILLDLNPSYSPLNMALLFNSNKILTLITPNVMCETSIVRLLDYSSKISNFRHSKQNIYVSMVMIKCRDKWNEETKSYCRQPVEYQRIYTNKMKKYIKVLKQNNNVAWVGIIPKIDKFENYQNEEKADIEGPLSFYQSCVTSVRERCSKEIDDEIIDEISHYFEEVDNEKIAEYDNPDSAILYILKYQAYDTTVWKVGKTRDFNTNRLNHVIRHKEELLTRKVYVGKREFVDMLEEKTKKELKKFKKVTTEEFISNQVTDTLFEMLMENSDVKIDFAFEF